MLEQYNISNGVDLLFIPNNKFHTSLVSFNFFLPISKENVSSFSLLASILTTCSNRFKDYRLLNLELSRLYGADISSNVTKIGDNLCLKFKVSTINDEHAIDGGQPILEAVAMLMDMLFNPKVSNNSFELEDIKRERRMLIEHINGELNDKRAYARKRLIEEMFDNDAYGLYRLGNVKDIEKLNGEQLFKAWEYMIKHAVVKINVIGKELPSGIVNEIKEHFLNRNDILSVNETVPTAYRNEVKHVTERFDVAQGKLVMGFTSVAGNDENSIDALVMCDVFGGGPYSLLFNNVREKQSLCYYCSAQNVRSKGYIVVDSGIEAQNANKALNEILKQLDAMKNAEFNDYEFEASKKGLTDSLLAANDSLGGIDAWYTLRALQKKIYSPEELVDKVKNVTKQDVVNVAKKVKLNTVYMLLPKEAE